MAIRCVEIKALTMLLQECKTLHHPLSKSKVARTKTSQQKQQKWFLNYQQPHNALETYGDLNEFGHGNQMFDKPSMLK